MPIIPPRYYEAQGAPSTLAGAVAPPSARVPALYPDMPPGSNVIKGKIHPRNQPRSAEDPPRMRVRIGVYGQLCIHMAREWDQSDIVSIVSYCCIRSCKVCLANPRNLFKIMLNSSIRIKSVEREKGEGSGVGWVGM